MRKFVSLGESRPSQSSSNEELLAMDYELGYFDLETRARAKCSKTRSAQKCHPSDRYIVLPMPPGRTNEIWRGRRNSNHDLGKPSS